MPRIIKPATGSFTTASVSIDSSGRVYSAATGAAGGAGYIPTFIASNDGSGNHQVSNNTSKILAYVRGGGGGGGGSRPGGGGVGGGGGGGFGFWNHPVTSGETLAYTIGTGGAHGNISHNAGIRNGQSGNASTLDSNLTANGGGAGPAGGNSNEHNSPAGFGDAPGATFDVSSAGGFNALPGGALMPPEGMATPTGGTVVFASGGGGRGYPGQTNGHDGSVVIWENIG